MNWHRSSVIIIVGILVLAGCGGVQSSDSTPGGPIGTDLSSTTVATTTVPPTVETPLPPTTTTPNSPTTNASQGVTCTITGTDGDDELYGTSGNDVICGRDGNDTIAGGGGNDVIYGHHGGDVISGGEGNDELYGGKNGMLMGGALPAMDEIHGGSGADMIFGGHGQDDLHGEEGNDIIAGGIDLMMDSLSGGPDDDVLFPGVGSTEVGTTGGNGSDIAVMLDGNPDGWTAGTEPAPVPDPITIPKLPAGIKLSLNPTTPSEMISASAFKDRLSISANKDVCLCDPNDQTL